MVKRLLSLLLCLALVLPAALAASYPDLPESHWAYAAMDRAHELGILTGQPGGAMEPAGPLTWGQYLTLLGRTFYRETYEAAAPGGSHWAAKAWTAGRDVGLLPEDDFLDVTGDSLDRAITRQEAVVLLTRLLELHGGVPDFGFLTEEGDLDPAAAFSDWDQMAPGYQAAVRTAFARGMVNGMPDGTFSGGNPLNRAEGCVLLMRLVDRLDADLHGELVSVTLHGMDESGGPLGDRVLELAVGTDYGQIPGLEGYTFVGPRGMVSSLSRELTLTYRPQIAAERTQEEALAMVSRGELSWDEYYMQDFWLKMPGENRRKCLFLFGDEGKRRFASQEEADAGVAEVTVPVWRLNTETGVKTAGTATLTVHAALAEEVEAIFTEIFDDPEQFPIKNLGGYDWRGDTSPGEHNCGTAIDLNWEENYQVYNDGRVGAGSYWTPGEDPFSIPEDGSVVRIFAAHGFAWGGNAWSTSKDYMHFSYLGK